MKILIGNILTFAVLFDFFELNDAGDHRVETKTYNVNDPQTPITMFLDDDELHVEPDSYKYRDTPYRLFNQVSHTSDPHNDPKYQVIIGGNKHFKFEEDDHGRVLNAERVPTNKRPDSSTRIRTHVATVLGKQFLLHKERGRIVGASPPYLTNQIPVPQIGQRQRLKNEPENKPQSDTQSQ